MKAVLVYVLVLKLSINQIVLIYKLCDYCYCEENLSYEDISIIRENRPKRGFFGLGREKNLPPHQGFIAPNKKCRFNLFR
mgnify:CR=1 FL=1